MASTRRGRGRPAGPGVDVEQRRSDLLDAAERAIRAKGPDAGIADIAQEAGFVRSAVYAVFPNRAAIMSALSERQARRLLAEITRRASGSTALRRRMELFFDVVCKWIKDEPNLHRALNVHDHLAGAVEAMLSISLAAGDASTAPAAPWARAIVGSATVTAEWWIRSSSMPRTELVEHLTNLCWDGGSALPFTTFDVAAIDKDQP